MNNKIIRKALATVMTTAVILGAAGVQGFTSLAASADIATKGFSKFSTSFGLDVTVTSDKGSLEKLAEIPEGKYADLRIEGSISDEAAAKIKAVADEKGVKIANEMEIMLFAMNKNGSQDGRVDELSDEIKFTIKAPANVDGEKYDFSLLRLHAGEVDVLKDLDDDPKTITFLTDKFSTYAIVYADKTGSAATKQAAAANRAPKTADANLTLWISLMIMLFGIGIVWYAFGGIERINRNREE